LHKQKRNKENGPSLLLLPHPISKKRGKKKTPFTPLPFPLLPEDEKQIPKILQTSKFQL
jgi:hypothetical protein